MSAAILGCTSPPGLRPILAVHIRFTGKDDRIASEHPALDGCNIYWSPVANPRRVAIVSPGDYVSCSMDNTRPIASTITLIVVLLLLIPPYGILSDNEENYFAVAERFVDGSPWPEKTAVFDASRHLMLGNATLGLLVSVMGYAPTQVVTRLLAVGGYALTLPALFSVFGLSALDAALAVMVMALIGQDIIGGEWLFGGYEAKVAAYLLVLAGLRLVLVSKRLRVSVILFTLATYIHFLVGGFWFIAGMALRLLDKPCDLRRVTAAMALYALLVMPLFGVIEWSRFADTGAVTAAGVPPPDVIYSIIREPHHQSPFLSWAYFRDHWLPGYLMFGPMVLACLWAAWHTKGQPLGVLAKWLAGLLMYLFLILGPKFLDRNSGVLGKFYLFRPSSLILLLWLLLVTAIAGALMRRRIWLLRACLVFLIGPFFLYNRGGQLMRTVTENEAREHQKRPLLEAVTRMTAPGEIVLIDPDEESQLLDFERRASVPTFVMWKFAPTNDADLVLWYRRLEVRRILFEQGCGTRMHTPDIVYVLTTPSRALRLATSCGPEALRVGPWVLLRTGTNSPPVVSFPGPP
jgi:hypothetical protein